MIFMGVKPETIQYHSKWSDLPFPIPPSLSRQEMQLGFSTGSLSLDGEQIASGSNNDVPGRGIGNSERSDRLQRNALIVGRGTENVDLGMGHPRLLDTNQIAIFRHGEFPIPIIGGRQRRDKVVRKDLPTVRGR